ncbi:MAG: glycoside hydrolase family 127 protein [Chitinophagaceae bacterium]|nr:glycoside hydrolase family 127 protein [Chitinophagaceae bacterium]
MVNGEKAEYTIDNGYAVLKRNWKKGDIVTMDLPMKVRSIVSNDEVKQNANKVALQYGPIVYCVEGEKDGLKAGNVILPDNTTFETTYEPALLGGVNVLHFDAPVVTIGNNGLSVSTSMQKITAIPYYTWNNLGANDMLVWLPENIQSISIN